MMDKARLVVVGGGPAGASAAIEAAKAGVQVVLIDENPLGLSMMGLDTPLFFGQRMMPTVNDRGLMLQRVVASSELLGAAQENGVELLLGTYVWGSFRNQENSRQVEQPVLGLADEERSWLMEYERLILAPGARDLVMAFAGRELVGVMGANAVASLINCYQSLTTRRMAVLGSGDLGLFTACLALKHGIEVVAIVDISPAVRGNGELQAELESRGVPFYTSHTVQEARGHREVESIVITQVDEELRLLDGGGQELGCDTICLAMGLVPNVELPYITGCRLNFRAASGGFVSDRDERMRTSIDNVYVVGDTGGFCEAMVTNPNIAMGQGRAAGIAVAESLGFLDRDRADSLRRRNTPSLDVPEDDSQEEYRSAWLSSLIAAGGMDVAVCQCEAVSRGDILNVTPPRYLQWSSEEMGRRSMDTLMQDGPINLDQLKRLTRAGMGYCQGRRCREELTMLVARSRKVDISQIPLASYRPPVRPLPLKVMWPQEETDQDRSGWVKWFRYPTE
ncbi:MAG: NAD(P)/FAD-dependent oxidoreductase [Dehalococcoidia bacterium]